MTRQAMLQTLQRWRDAGWLRHLDLALARFVHQTDPAAPASLLLGSALLACLEGRGHAALPLAQMTAELPGVLGWPPEAADEWRAAAALWPGDGGAWPSAWQGLAAVQLEPADDAGVSPLVVSGGLLYLRRYWRCEMRLAAQLHARAAGLADDIDVAAARALLDRLFESKPPDEPPDWQKIACALALRGRLTLVTGGPGTGKTYTAARLLALLQSLHGGAQPLRVALAAPTGKAAARLRQAISQALQGLDAALAAALALPRWVALLGPARTLHSLLGTQPGTRRLRHDAAQPLDVDDKDQLASVEAGAVLADLCHGAGEGGAAAGYTAASADWVRRLTGDELPAQLLGSGPPLAQQTVVLRRSRRFDGPIGQLAQSINRADASAALQLLRQHPDGPVALITAHDASAALPLALQGRGGAPGGYRAYLEQLARRPAAAAGADFDAWVQAVLRSFRVLCALREGPWGVAGLNQAIERVLAQAGLLARRGDWYEGRPVMVTRNDPALGVFNGDTGIVLRGAAADAPLRCWFLDGDSLRSVSVARLAEVETAFATTVHKSQGSEFEHVVLVLPDEDVAVLTRELIYTGITRARRAFTLVAKQPALLATASGRLTRRVSGLRQRL